MIIRAILTRFTFEGILSVAQGVDGVEVGGAEGRVEAARTPVTLQRRSIALALVLIVLVVTRRILRARVKRVQARPGSQVVPPCSFCSKIRRFLIAAFRLPAQGLLAIL
jgi:hypothetical protein